jgi:hypothetical protein
LCAVCVCRVRVRAEPAVASKRGEHQRLRSSQWNPRRYPTLSGRRVALPQPLLVAHLQVVTVANGQMRLMKRQRRRRMAAQAARPPRTRRKQSHVSSRSKKQAPWASGLRCAALPSLTSPRCQTSDRLTEASCHVSGSLWRSMFVLHDRRPMTRHWLSRG